MKLHKWTVCEPVDFSGSEVSLISLIAHGCLVSVHLECDSLRFVALHFSRVMAFRQTGEEAIQHFIREFHGDNPPPTGPFWMADRNDWIDDLHPEDWNFRAGAEHYCIFTSETLIEIVAEQPPAIVCSTI